MADLKMVNPDTALSGDSQRCFSFQQVMSPRKTYCPPFFSHGAEIGFSLLLSANTWMSSHRVGILPTEILAGNGRVHPENCALFQQEIGCST